AQKPLLSRVKPPPGTKGSFVPGGGFTRDKRGASYIFAQPPPSSNTHFLDLRRAAVVSPIAPPVPPPSPSAARAPPPPRSGRLGRRPRQATHRCAAVPGPMPPRLRRLRPSPPRRTN